MLLYFLFVFRPVTHEKIFYLVQRIVNFFFRVFIGIDRVLAWFFQSGINDIDRASIFNALALLANKKERYDKALEYYIFAYIFTGGNQTLSEKIIHNIAIAQYRLKKVDRAISCYEFLLEKNPNDEKASRKLGGISAHYQPKKTA